MGRGRRRKENQLRIPWDNKEVYVGMRKEMGREKKERYQVCSWR